MTKRSITLLCVLSMMSIEPGHTRSGDLIVQFRHGIFAVIHTQISSDAPDTLFHRLDTEGGEAVLHVHRLMVDRERRFYFGYDLEVDPIAGKKQIRVTVSGLSPEYQKRIRLSPDYAGIQPHPDLNPEFARSRDTQVLGDGGTFRLDLLINPKSGVSIADIVRVGLGTTDIQQAAHVLSTIKTKDSQPPRDFALEDVAFRLEPFDVLINDQKVEGVGGSCSGAVVFFFIGGRGRFIFSVVPRPGFPFEKTAIVDGNSLLFTHGGERYELVSQTPILSGGAKYSVWMLHDPAFQMPAPLGDADVTRPPFAVGASASVEPLFRIIPVPVK